MSKIIECFKETVLPEKYYEACVTYNIISYFHEKRDEIIYPFSISQVKEKKEGYDFGYEGNNKIFLLQYKRPRQLRDDCYSWEIDKDQLEVIINNSYGNLTYYALPSFDDYKLWYEALCETNMKFVDALTVQRYLDKTGRKSINSNWDGLKCWEQVVDELFGVNSYKSALEVETQNCREELLRILEMEGVIGYEVDAGGNSRKF